MSDLIAVHGGLREPLDLSIPEAERSAVLAEAKALEKIPVSDADLSTVYRFGDGALSPLTGPMDRKTYDRVLDESVIEHDGKLYAWTIPLALPVSADLAAKLRPGQKMALVNTAGDVVATLLIDDVFAWDKARYLESVYLTERTDHPGADMVLKGDADKTHLVGGKIRMLPQPKTPGVRQVRPLAARGSQAAGEQGLGARRRVPDPQPAASRPRVRVGLRPGDAAARGAQRRRLPEPADRRDQGRRRQRRRSACTPTSA